jgi:hypothetical protein
LHCIPGTFVNIPSQAIVSYLCLNLAITPIFIACQTQLMLSVFAVLFFFINTSLILIILGLEYLGLAILLVYAGAIIMILLFVIMLVKLQETENQPFAALAPSRWASNQVSFQGQHVQYRSLFLILAITLGALLLTYSCKTLIIDLTPAQQTQDIISPYPFSSVNCYDSLSGFRAIRPSGDVNDTRALFSPYSNDSNQNHIP